MKNKINELDALADKYQKYNPAIFVFTKEINGNPHNHILAKDRDDYIIDYSDDECETLYKFTTIPCAADYTSYTPLAEIYGNSEKLMEELIERSLDVNPNSLKYSRYIMDFEIDSIDTENRVVYL